MRTWAALVATYGVMTAGGWAASSRPADPVTGLALVAVAVLLAYRPGRLTAGAVAVVGFVAATGPAPSTMTVTVGWVSLALAAFTGDDRRQALRVFVTAVYGFAAANKLASARFMDGEIIDGLVPWVPRPEWVAWAVVAAEACLALAAWRRERWLPAAVLGFHLPLVVFAPPTIGGAVTLAAYAGMMAWASSRFVGDVPLDDITRRERERRTARLA